MERQLLNNLPSLEGKQLLRALSNLLTSPHLNKIELGHAMLGTYVQVLEKVHPQNEKDWILKEIRDIAQRLRSEITHSHGAIRARRRSPK